MRIGGWILEILSLEVLAEDCSCCSSLLSPDWRHG